MTRLLLCANRFRPTVVVHRTRHRPSLTSRLNTRRTHFCVQYAFFHGDSGDETVFSEASRPSPRPRQRLHGGRWLAGCWANVLERWGLTNLLTRSRHHASDLQSDRREALRFASEEPRSFSSRAFFKAVRTRPRLVVGASAKRGSSETGCRSHLGGGHSPQSAPTEG